MFKENNPKAFENKVWLARPTMHGDELKYMQEAYDTNWMTTLGSNINELEKGITEFIGCKYTVALSCGTSALHLAIRLAGQDLYHQDPKRGALEGQKVFCSDMTFDATVNPISYEGGEQVFIDSEYETWNMDPKALEKAFEKYSEVKLVVLAHLYGTPAQLDKIKAICDKHNAILIEDAAESLGATYDGKQTGSYGKYNTISFNGNKIITGSSGGMFLTDDEEAYNTIRKWSTQARDVAPWYQHSELGFNYRMSNVIAGVARGQLPYLQNHIDRKKAIFEKYGEGLKNLPIKMNPHTANSIPNYWLSCMIIDEEAMCRQERTDSTATFSAEEGRTCPTEILETLLKINAEGRPIWKPMHMQPIYSKNDYIYAGEKSNDEDVFERGLCLPSDITMTEEEQKYIIETIRKCFE